MAAAPSQLPPVAFHQHPAAISVDPTMTHPHRMLVWRTIPAAGNPNVSIPVPSVITADPYITRSRCGYALFNDLSWRVYSNHNLFAVGTNKPKRCYKQGIRNYFTHHVLLATMDGQRADLVSGRRLLGPLKSLQH